LTDRRWPYDSADADDDRVLALVALSGDLGVIGERRAGSHEQQQERDPGALRCTIR
jgi:hypothetical protein